MAIWGLVFLAYSNSFHEALVFAKRFGDCERFANSRGDATKHRVQSTGRILGWGSERAANSGLYRPFTRAGTW